MILISILITICIQIDAVINSVAMHASLTLSRPLPSEVSALPLTAPDGPVCDITSSLTQARPATLWSLAIHSVLVAGLLGFQGLGANAETPPASISVTLVAPAAAPATVKPDLTPHAAQAPAEPTFFAPPAPPAMEAPAPPLQPLADMPPTPPEPIDLPLPEAAPPLDVAALAPPPPPSRVAETMTPAPKVAPPPVKATEKPKAPPAARPKPAPVSVPTAATVLAPPLESAAAAQTATSAATTASAPAEEATKTPPAPSTPSGELALLAPPIITEPKPLVEPQKNYPKLAIKMGQQGIVQLAVEIDESGKVLDSSIRASSGFPLLDRQARIDIKTALFSPYHFNGRPIRHTAYLPMKYELR